MSFKGTTQKNIITDGVVEEMKRDSGMLQKYHTSMS